MSGSGQRSRRLGDAFSSPSPDNSNDQPADNDQRRSDSRQAPNQEQYAAASGQQYARQPQQAQQQQFAREQYAQQPYVQPQLTQQQYAQMQYAQLQQAQQQNNANFNQARVDANVSMYYIEYERRRLEAQVQTDRLQAQRVGNPLAPTPTLQLPPPTGPPLTTEDMRTMQMGQAGREAHALRQAREAQRAQAQPWVPFIPRTRRDPGGSDQGAGSATNPGDEAPNEPKRSSRRRRKDDDESLG